MPRSDGYYWATFRGSDPVVPFIAQWSGSGFVHAWYIIGSQGMTPDCKIRILSERIIPPEILSGPLEVGGFVRMLDAAWERFLGEQDLKLPPGEKLQREFYPNPGAQRVLLVEHSRVMLDCPHGHWLSCDDVEHFARPSR